MSRAAIRSKGCRPIGTRAPGRRAMPPLRAHQLKDVAVKLQERRQADVPLTAEQSELVVQDVLNIVQDMLSAGDDVVLRGFGKFTCKEMGRRDYRNPRTGMPVTKDNVVKVSFRPSTTLKKHVEEKVAGKN